MLEERIGEALGGEVVRTAPLTGGCIAQVSWAKLADGREVVVKADPGPAPRLSIEGYMLDYLARHSSLPVPRVHHSADDLLIMDFLPGDSTFSAQAQIHAADLLADLHDVSAPTFGLERDTLIGALDLPNPQTETSWLDFFRAWRLIYPARVSVERGRMGRDLLARVERFGHDLERWLDEPDAPALVHGDVWTTNVLAQGDRITGFLDPAIYFGHGEMDLAYIALFSSFGQPFFQRYNERRPIAPGFFETRRHIYALYPLLVHVWHFGGGYPDRVSSVLDSFGY